MTVPTTVSASEPSSQGFASGVLRETAQTTRSSVRNLIKGCVNTLGYDVVRIYNSPASTLLGLRNLPIRTVIDVGANVGQFATTMCSVFPQAEVICFEPQEQAFRLLQRRARQFGGRVTVCQTAIGDYEGFVDLRIHTAHDPSSSVLATTRVSDALYPFTKEQAVRRVPITTLDAALRRSNTSLTPDVLIKIDAQGYDDRVIRGGTISFNRARALIVEIILESLYENQATFADIFCLVNQMGFAYAGNLDQTYARDGHVIFIDAVFIR